MQGSARISERKKQENPLPAAEKMRSRGIRAEKDKSHCFNFAAVVILYYETR